MNPVRIINSLRIERTLLRKSPLPLFAKEGLYSSLWKREVRRDFIKQCYYASFNRGLTE